MHEHAWVLEILKRIDSAGPAGWSSCAPIWRDVVTGDSAETAEDLESHAMLLALNEMEHEAPELHRIVQTWRISGFIDDRQEEAITWLAVRVDRMLG